jgi:hypothetical protein
VSSSKRGYAAYMWPATAWDDADWDGNRARGWTVMRTLRERQQARIREADAARRRTAERETRSWWMTPAAMQQEYEDKIKAGWRGGPTVIAFLFAHPDSDAMRMLDARGEYFDVRTGDTWDLFFPGYYRSTEGRAFEEQADAQPIGRGFGGDWYFNANGFNDLRRYIEQASERRWEYSGGTDLVLINGWLATRAEPTIDWASTISGQITDQAAGTRTLTLANVIERITRDLETVAEDASYGVGEVTDEPSGLESHITRDIMINALGGIAAALGAKALGM